MRILVVGGGSIGKRHIANLISIDRVSTIQVVEPAKSVQAEIVRQFGAQIFSSVEEALADGRFDAALICSPNNLHVSHAVELASRGCHIFVEKPLAPNYLEARPLVSVVTESKVSVMVGCNLRFHPGVTVLRRAILNGDIGRPLYARAQFAHFLPNWRRDRDYRETYSARRSLGGGILLDDVHEPDYLCWIFGKVVRVQGMLVRLGELEIDVEDIADYVLWHGERFYSHVHSDYLRRDKVRGCEIVGTHGSLVWRSRGKNPEDVNVSLCVAPGGDWQTLFSDSAYDLNHQYRDEIEYFLDCVGNGQEPMNGLTEALELMKTLDGVRKAAHLRCEVAI